MKIVRNTGSERVIDLIRPKIQPGGQLDAATPSLSLFAFNELLTDLDALKASRLLGPSLKYKIFAGTCVESPSRFSAAAPEG